jgi:hypothetical protein
MDKDPRSPSWQFADWLKNELKFGQIGAVQAAEILVKAKIAREAARAYNSKRGIPFDLYLEIWMREAEKINERHFVDS